MSKYFLEDVLHIEGAKKGLGIGVGLIAYLSETCLLCYGNVPLLHSRALDPYHYLPYMRDYLHDIDLGDSEFNEKASRGFNSQLFGRRLQPAGIRTVGVEAAAPSMTTIYCNRQEQTEWANPPSPPELVILPG